MPTKLKSIFTVLFFGVLFVSCDNEVLDPVILQQINTNANNNPGNGNPTNTTISGTYLLTAFNSSVATDLNGDGVSSINQMNETSCFNGSSITLNANNTFTATGNGVEIDLSTTPNTIVCTSEPATTGTWSLSGNQLSTTYVEGGITYTDVVTVVGNTLVYSASNGEVVGIANGVPVYLTANLTVIYSKQ